jgi:8-oxo-dGTP pyrophosphatase MutT (NUDIX family)
MCAERDMMTEKILRVVSVVFRRLANSQRVFLLLHRCLNWSGWEFPKGEMEPNESAEEAVVREIFEETGFQKIRIVKKIRHSMTFFDRVRRKESEVFGFLVESFEEKPVFFGNNPAREHDSFEWADEKTVLKKLRFDNMRELFRVALREHREGKEGDKAI